MDTQATRRVWQTNSKVVTVAIALVVVGFMSACADGGTETDGPPLTEDEPTHPRPTVDFEVLLEQVQQEVPAASQSSDLMAAPAGTTFQTMGDYLTFVIQNVDQYWTKTLVGAGLPESQVQYNWVLPGQPVATGCEREGVPEVTSDDSAFYCPVDDTIYISQQFAYNFWNGLVAGQPTGVTPGDFGVAYVVAHEYAHNLQHELGIYETYLPGETTMRKFELQADCMAGAWGNSVYWQGILEAGDVEEAIDSAAAVGDFEFLEPDHHGTPQERIQAFMLGYNSGDPSQCNSYFQ